jgi:O-antigen ligase
MGLLVLVIFAVSFINIEWGLYILIFSMLLSPEIMTSETQGGSLARGVTLRLEDFLLVVIGASWFAKNAIFKELGLFFKTPLNKAILFYVLACIITTGFGIMFGRVDVKTGSFFVLKYIEYFIVFFMMVNHVKSTEQVKRFIFCLFLTCFIAAIIGILQIPGGERVSAPFEGEIGEPNTFGGYLLFIGVMAAGLLSRVENSKTRQRLIILIICIIPPFLFTQSRSSFVAFIPACVVLGFFSERRLIIMGLIVIAFLLSPLLLPSSVKQRIMFTFTQPEESGQITIGSLRLDTSTSARLASWKDAFADWPEHPILGYGVTGYKFVDAQFPRVLAETGLIGLTAFFYLLYSIFKMAVRHLREVKTPYFKGLCIGFLAGYIGLLVHAIGANTFIIVRIMEPFWFFVGIIAVLPMLEQQNTAQSQEAPAPDNTVLSKFKRLGQVYPQLRKG